MTIQQLLDGVKVNWIHVNVIEKLSETHYIIGDATGLAVMETTATHQKYIEVGQGLKLIKPKKIETDVIGGDQRFNPMKTKPMALPNLNPKRMAKLQSAPKPDCKQIDHIDFETIQNDYPENSIVSKTLMYVVNVSRLIDGNFGKYRICNIRDTKSHALTLSLYEPHVEKLQDDQVYSMTKVRKTIMKNDGQT